ncbi:MAG: NAD(P)-dependent oxidoreductase [Holophaga sp.]|nr:NAD(P)-dependent oxidoreductase [Holophaga sp.]
MSLSGKTLLITGGTRGIGLAIALRAARDGARVAILGKTAAPHARLPGTVFTAAAEVEAAGGRALAIVGDVRSEESVLDAVAQTVAAFGGLDILVNNASAISLTGTLDTELKRYDLMHQVNARGTFLCSKACIPHLKRAGNPHILTLAPPLDLQAKWFAPHPAYTMAKFGMSLCTLAMAEEFRADGIAVNALWPLTAIDTAAVRNLLGGEAMTRACRRPEIVADAAHAILVRPARECTGRFFIDEEVLRAEGVGDFTAYAVDPKVPLVADYFLPDAVLQGTPTRLQRFL